MNQIRRKSIENISRKKFRIRTIIEYLSNEIFYEIFEYLDACDILNGFSNLNKRFQTLLNHPSLRLKMSIQFKTISQFQHDCIQYILPNQHRIISLRFIDLYYINPFLQICHLNSLFNYLESLVFINIKPDEFISILPNLAQLSNLLSLTVFHGNDCRISIDFYYLIFCLPHLKYNKLSSNTSAYQISSSSSSSSLLNKQISQIEYLIMDHPCDLNQLIVILSCTPQLRYLTCKRMIDIEKKIKSKNLMRLSNLTHIFFYQCRVPFDVFEIFIQKISSKLRVLYINTSLDNSYLDADRWERIITQYLPLLQTFHFEYSDFMFSLQNVLVNKFTSSFWTDRQWILNIKVDMYQESTTKMTYSIHRHKKKWFKFYYSTDNLAQDKDISDEERSDKSSIPFSEGTEFIVQGHGLVKFNQTFIANIDSFFPIIQITCLHIGYFYPFDIDVLVELSCLLPNLDSLIISFVSSRQIRNLSEQQLNMIRLAANNNRIIRVRIGGLTNLEQLHTFLTLCPRMQHIEFGHTDDIDRKLLIRLIMMKNIDQIPYLCSMYLWMPEVNEKLFKTFQKNTDLDKLLDKYKITCMSNGIYLQWDRHRLVAIKKLSYMHLRNQKH